MQKKSKKNLQFLKKNFFSLETTLNALKFVRNTICAVHDKFQLEICKKSQKNLKCLKVRNTICAVHDKFQAGISQKSS